MAWFDRPEGFVAKSFDDRAPKERPAVIETDDGWYTSDPDGWDDVFIARAPAAPKPDLCRHCGVQLSANAQKRHDHIANCAVWK